MPYKDPITRQQKDKEYKRLRRLKNPAKWRSLGVSYRLKNLEKFKVKERKYQVAQYGLTLEDYNSLFLKQNGLCAICGVGQEKSLDIDHCHKTKKVRGLLCRKCNLAIGFFLDNSALCKKATEYLQ